MTNGDIVFFKKAKASPHRKAPEVMFKGQGFGLLLGHCPPFAQTPPKEFVIKLIGSIGYLSFDDVVEFFGPEIGAECVKKFEAKYCAPELAGPAQEELPLDQAAPGLETEEAPEPAPSGLVGLNGKPLHSDSSVSP